MKLILVVGLDGLERTCTFAAAIVSHLDQESYEWVLECYKTMTEGASGLSCIFSDRDPAFKKAMKESMPGIHHFACMWHLANNIKEKGLSFFGKDSGPRTNKMMQLFYI
ncbi:unnamed protein product, partial [Chrysoparadoxa australica]